MTPFSVGLKVKVIGQRSNIKFASSGGVIHQVFPGELSTRLTLNLEPGSLTIDGTAF